MKSNMNIFEYIYFTFLEANITLGFQVGVSLHPFAYIFLETPIAF